MRPWISVPSIVKKRRFAFSIGLVVLARRGSPARSGRAGSRAGRGPRRSRGGRCRRRSGRACGRSPRSARRRRPCRRRRGSGTRTAVDAAALAADHELAEDRGEAAVVARRCRCSPCGPPASACGSRTPRAPGRRWPSCRRSARSSRGRTRSSRRHRAARRWRSRSGTLVVLARAEVVDGAAEEAELDAALDEQREVGVARASRRRRSRRRPSRARRTPRGRATTARRSRRAPSPIP